MAADIITLDGRRDEVAARPGLPAEDLAVLRGAVETLERSTLVGRLSAMAGKPLELLGQTLPAAATETVAKATEMALRGALKMALTTLRFGRGRGIGVHRAAAVASGAIGGAFGFASLPLELPVSTTVMLRAIGEVAREAGEDLSDPETALACLQVFALGSNAGSGGFDVTKGGYLAVRATLAKSIAEAARLAAGRGLTDKAAPVFVRLVGQIASRFGIVVSQKLAASAVPIVGALGGAAVNAAFLEHFRTIAIAHFTVRRLERQHGEEVVRAAYQAIRDGMA